MLNRGLRRLTVRSSIEVRIFGVEADFETGQRR